ncbi:MAG: metallophosphoesterase [Actinomycetes bacterium]
MRWLVLVVVAFAGAAVGWTLAPPTTADVGPLQVDVEVMPSLHSGVTVELPPVGQVEFDTHPTPVELQASVRSVDVDQARELISSPHGLLNLQLTAPEVIERAARRAAAVAVGCGVLGAAVSVLAVYRAWRAAAQGAGAVLAVCVVLGLVTFWTFEPRALQQPRFTGLLSRAPYIAGQGRDVVQRLESYRSGLADFIQSVTTVYGVADQLPAAPHADGDTTTILHISDIHLNPMGFDLAQKLVQQFGVDAVVDTGDITTWGTELESPTLSRIGGLGVPYVFVRGNHDSAQTQAAVAAQPNAVVLDGNVAEVAGLTFAGIGDPVFTPDGEGGTGSQSDREAVAAATQQLADVVTRYDRDHPEGRGVDVALVHDPWRLDPLFGEVPLVLAGHYHHRITRTDSATGTRVMVEGSTGGAGLTAAGLRRLGEGEPVPLTATLLYFATSGERAGQLVAYDEVTVGGLGLTSVTVARTTLPATTPTDRAEPVGTPSVGGGSATPGP